MTMSFVIPSPDDLPMIDPIQEISEKTVRALLENPFQCCFVEGLGDANERDVARFQCTFMNVGWRLASISLRQGMGEKYAYLIGRSCRSCVATECRHPRGFDKSVSVWNAHFADRDQYRLTPEEVRTLEALRDKAKKRFFDIRTGANTSSARRNEIWPDDKGGKPLVRNTYADDLRDLKKKSAEFQGLSNDIQRGLKEHADIFDRQARYARLAWYQSKYLQHGSCDIYSLRRVLALVVDTPEHGIKDSILDWVAETLSSSSIYSGEF